MDASVSTWRPDEELVSIETVAHDSVRAHVKVAGELDVSTGPTLWAVLQGHLERGRRFLRLDMSAVTFLDAAALSGITRAHQDALARRGTLVLTGIRPNLTRVLQLVHLDHVLFIGGPRSDDDLPGDPSRAADRAADPVQFPARVLQGADSPLG